MFEKIQGEQREALVYHLEQSYDEMMKAVDKARQILSTETRKFIRTAQKRILSVLPDLIIENLELRDDVARGR